MPDLLEPASGRDRIARIIAAGEAEVSVAWRPLDAPPGSARELLIEPGRRFHAASTVKLPAMIELFRQAAAGTLSLDDELTITNTFRSLVDGSPYDLSPEDDADPELYAAIGSRVTLRVLCEAMVTASSNLAANLLADRLGLTNIQATLRRLGASGMEIRRGVEDRKAFDRGLNNTTDAASLLTLLWKLGRGEAADPAGTTDMLAMLTRQKFNDGIPAGLPAGTPVAHKTGTITGIHHDAGIVFGPAPYVLVVLVEGLEDRRASARLIAAIARAAHQISASPPESRR